MDQEAAEYETVSMGAFLSLFGETLVSFHSSSRGHSTYYSEFPKRGEPRNVVSVTCDSEPVYRKTLKVSDILVTGVTGIGEVIRVDFVNPAFTILKTDLCTVPSEGHPSGG